MNTTSLIQGLCKEKDQQIMISEALMNRSFNNFIFEALGDIRLRGKIEYTKVYGVSGND